MAADLGRQLRWQGVPARRGRPSTSPSSSPSSTPSLPPTHRDVLVASQLVGHDDLRLVKALALQGAGGAQQARVCVCVLGGRGGVGEASPVRACCCACGACEAAGGRV